MTEAERAVRKLERDFPVADCNAFGGIGAISSVQDIITITRTIRAAMVSLSVSFASWAKSVEDQQQLLVGKAFKTIPIQTASLEFLQDTK